jgi:pimeloyl-ACP methyl ester carboxylesterase
VSLYYEQAGSGETVAFVGEAGYGAWQWGWQHDAVAGPFEALVWDLRGTGRSDAPADSYDIDTLAADLEAVLSDSEARRAHLVGAGLGGMVALRHAREYDRTATLSLFGTAPGAAIDEDAFRALHAEDEERLRESLAGAFSESFRDREIIEQICKWRAQEDASAAAFDAQSTAALEFEPGPLYEQQLPTVVYQGLDDPVVPVAAGRQLAADLPRGTFEAVEGRHLCFIEHARAVNDRLVTFLDEHARE